jgi:Leucine-rich repeat (LRR) protein
MKFSKLLVVVIVAGLVAISTAADEKSNQSTENATTLATPTTVGNESTTLAATTTTTQKPLENVICKKCKCDKEAKILNCSNLNLDNTFTVEEWTAFNSSDGDYETVKFDHNHITILNIQFPELKFSIKSLTFAHNKISKISKAIFKNLKSLEVIDLSYNQLEAKNLQPDVFEGRYSADMYEPLSKVKTLILTNNSLHTLHPDIFEHLPNLEVFKINMNVFQVLPDNIINVLSSVLHLRELDMSDMELEELPKYLFKANNDLKILNLAGNLFETIPQAVGSASNLEQLNLDENPIRFITSDYPMPPMKKLEVLNISFTEALKLVDEGGMKGLPNLKVLSMNNNPNLWMIHPDAFEFPEEDNPRIKQYPQIRQLYLQNNNLSTLHQNIIYRMDELKHVELHNNPWLCDCQLQWIIDHVVPKMNETSPSTISRALCKLPVALKDRKLVDLSSRHANLRCLDKYGNNPSHDGAVLIALLVGMVIAAPIVLIVILMHKRGLCDLGRLRGSSYNSRAFYKRAESFES